MNKQQTIKTIKKELASGKILQVFTDKKEKINIWLSENNKYIFWLHYGQSAVKNNLRDLTWLLNNILESKRQNIYFRQIKGIYE